AVCLDRAKLDRSARAFDEEVARWTAAAPAADTIETDGELAPAEIALDTAQALRSGGPWGQAFPEPCFDGLFSIRSARVIAERHVKMWVGCPRAVAPSMRWPSTTSRRVRSSCRPRAWRSSCTDWK